MGLVSTAQFGSGGILKYHSGDSIQSGFGIGKMVLTSEIKFEVR